MSSTLAYILLTLALILPVAGAFTLRLLSQRLTLPQLYGSALLIVGIAIASVLTLARSNITNLQVGSLSVLLPIEGSLDAVSLSSATIIPGLTLEQSSATAISGSQATTETATLSSAPTTETSVTSSTATLTTTVPATAIPTTEIPTLIPPTAVPPTPIPPTATPTAVPPTPIPPTAKPAKRTYKVQEGDTLRSIARKFNVDVNALLQANGLTAAQGDALQIGQELVIP